MITIALLTLRELTRRRFVPAAAAMTALLVALTAWGFSYLAHTTRHGVPVSHAQVLQFSSVLVILIAYLFSFIVAMLAVFLAAPSLANDIESGVLLPVLARPISRGAVLGGKALALSITVCCYAGAAGAAEFLAVRAATGYLPPHPGLAILYLCALSLVMLAFAGALATRMPAIAASMTAVVFFGIAWMGGIAQSLGFFLHNDAVRDAGTLTQLVLPSDAMWRSAVFELEPAAQLAAIASTHTWPGPFFVLSAPPPPILLWTVVWIAAVYAFATRSFTLRDL